MIPKKILITGSHGYLGSVLSSYLTKKGFLIKGIDTGFFLNSSLKKLPLNDSYDFIPKDVRDIEVEDLDGIYAVVHLAGISNDPMQKMDACSVYDPTRTYSSRLAEMCKRLSIRFIFASSCSVYGIGSNKLLNENSPVNPQTGYSLNKYQIEQDLVQLSGKDFSPIALRFATVFGPSPRLRLDIVINMLTAMAFVDNEIILNSDGQSWRPNLHIKDLCKSIYYCLINEIKMDDLLVLNVGDEINNMKIIDIASQIKELVPNSNLKFLTDEPLSDKSNLIKDRKVNSKDTRTYKVSFQKIKEFFPGFKCDYTVKDGIIEILEWLKNENFRSDDFKSKRFYRLQQLEYLLNNSFLSDDLRWKNKLEDLTKNKPKIF